VRHALITAGMPLTYGGNDFTQNGTRRKRLKTGSSCCFVLGGKWSKQKLAFFPAAVWLFLLASYAGLALLNLYFYRQLEPLQVAGSSQRSILAFLGRSAAVDWPSVDFVDRILERHRIASDDGSSNSSANTSTFSASTNQQRRLILIAVNSGYVDFADNLAHSLEVLHVFNFVLIPLDQRAFAALRRAYPDHTVPVMPAFGMVVDTGGGTAAAVGNVPSERADFGSAAFKHITSTRPALIQAFLQKNYTVLYSDSDMVWRQNAWQVMDDMRTRFDTGNAETTTTSMVWHDTGEEELCTCLLYLTPTAPILTLVQLWQYEVASGKHADDQRAFNQMARRLNFPYDGKHASAEYGLRVFPQDERFPSANAIDWTSPNSTNTSANQKAAVIHNNCIVGKAAKLQRFQTSGLWRPSGRLPQPWFPYRYWQSARLWLWSWLGPFFPSKEEREQREMEELRLKLVRRWEKLNRDKVV
jgi:Nucleotide-diphospho-sugar transferase